MIHCGFALIKHAVNTITFPHYIIPV